MTGWHQFPTVNIGGRFVASAEYFKDGRPVRTGGALTIRTGYGVTELEAIQALGL